MLPGYSSWYYVSNLSLRMGKVVSFATSAVDKRKVTPMVLAAISMPIMSKSLKDKS
jgi:hypothetical protein